MSLRSFSVVLAALSMLPLAACGGTGGGNGGGGSGTGGDTTTSTSTSTGSTTNSTTTTGSGATCATYCGITISCIDPAGCVLADPAGAEAACETACAAGLGVLTDAERDVLQPCFDCALGNAPPGSCFENLPAECDALCNSPAVEAAGQKWSDNSHPSPSDPATLCTNGMSPFSSGTCSGSGGGTTCSLECCNAQCGTTPDVGASCDTSATPATCTCTAGKNAGKTFQSTDPCGGTDELWNQCNL